MDIVSSATAQNLTVLISDDGSPATADPVLRSCAHAGAVVVRHARNAGIARGLNDGLLFAVRLGVPWLLTMDQDSTLPPSLTADLLRTAERGRDIGVVGVETMRDVTGDLAYPTSCQDGLQITEEVFQSGSLWSVSALAALGGFDARLGIDAVDAAACLALRQAGFKVVLAPGTWMEHRYGDGRRLQVLGRSVVATGHSPQRRESMVRNRLALAPAEFRQSPRHALRTLRRVGVNLLLAATVEEDRLTKVAGGLRGLLPRRDGGQRPPTTR